MVKKDSWLIIYVSMLMSFCPFSSLKFFTIIVYTLTKAKWIWMTLEKHIESILLFALYKFHEKSFNDSGHMLVQSPWSFLVDLVFVWYPQNLHVFMYNVLHIFFHLHYFKPIFLNLADQVSCLPLPLGYKSKKRKPLLLGTWIS